MILSTTLGVPTVQAQQSEEDLDRFIDEMNEKYRREQDKERHSEERPSIREPSISDPFVSDLVDQIVIDSKRLTDPKRLIPPERLNGHEPVDSDRLIPSRNERAYFIDVKPVQSVWSPSRYTQEKNIWWDVGLWYQLAGDPEYAHKPRNNITVELVTQGMECNKNGVECPTEYRLKGTWENIPFLSKLVKLTKENDPQLFTKMLDEDIDEVRVLRFEVPLQIVGQAADGTINSRANFVIPFDDDNSTVISIADNYLVRSHQNVWVQPAEPDSKWYLTPGSVKWKVTIDPDNELKGLTGGSKSEYGQNNSIRFAPLFIPEGGLDFSDIGSWWNSDDDLLAPSYEDQKFRILVVRMQLNYNACDDWNFWHERWWGGYPAWNDCHDRDMYTLNPPSLADAEAMIKKAKMKMQEMFPIPEDRLQIDLLPGVKSYTKTEGETINDWLGNILQRTFFAFDVIDLGIRIADGDEFQSKQYERVVILTHSDVASPSKDASDNMFGLLEFTGFCPCSKSAIVAGAEAETLIHEIGHSVLLSHDNASFMDSTFNNCGDTENYDWDIPPGKGWSPVDFDNLDTTNGVFLNGQSFMRYHTDGMQFDDKIDWDNWLAKGTPYDPNDYGFANSWIQNIDYRYVQTSMDYDAGDGYFGEYMKWLAISFLQQLVKIIWDLIVMLWDGFVWVLEEIWSAVKWVVSVVS